MIWQRKALKHPPPVTSFAALSMCHPPHRCAEGRIRTISITPSINVRALRRCGGGLAKATSAPAFDLADQILVADADDRARDLGFFGIGQFDHRQAGGRSYQAEQ